MGIKSILDKKLGIMELIRFDLICKLNKSHFGSRYLQEMIKSMESEERINNISLLINHLAVDKNVDLAATSMDVYGNYMVQLFFVYGNNVHHEMLMKQYINPSVLKLCQSQFGCRVIQTILSSVRNRRNLEELIDCFRKQIERGNKSKNKSNSIDRCLVSCNTNHVIQVMIGLKLPYKSLKFIGDALENNLAKYCENAYSCRVVQEFIKVYGDKLNVTKLLLDDTHLFLSCDKFGNYVIQCIVAKDEWYSELSLIKKFRKRLLFDIFSKENMLKLSNNKYGSNVMETCIKMLSEKQIDALLKTLCFKKGCLLKQMISHRFGNYVTKTLLRCCNKTQQRKLVNSVHVFCINLYDHDCNSKYLQNGEFIRNCQQIKYEMDKKYNKYYHSYPTSSRHRSPRY